LSATVHGDFIFAIGGFDGNYLNSVENMISIQILGILLLQCNSKDVILPL